MSQVKWFANVVLVTVFGCAILFSVGCQAVGDAFIPHHPASYVQKGCSTSVALQRSKYVPIEIKNEATNKPAGKGILPFAGMPAVASVVVDQAVKTAETEAKKYNAVYSARTSDYFNSTNGGTNETIQTIIVERKCSTNTVFKFAMTLVPDLTNGVFRIRPEQVVINKTASKNFAPGLPREWKDLWQYAPWKWPGNIISIVWWGLDDSISKVDFNVHVVIESIGFNEKHEGKNNVLCALNFPLGKRNIGDIAIGLNDIRNNMKTSQLSTIDSGFIPLRDPGTNVLDKAMPLNVTVTVTEGNDLGDIIGKGATELSKNKDSIVKKIVEAVSKE